ncbi:MAG TPA: TIGR03663 family protein [Roseiflexaceae bacterium]|nr:TIGR03663 family protein [Roseiflexaceae bacterium]HMP40875.1 TIGR03663 family protein [Roseiflexaceae bacterium]
MSIAELPPTISERMPAPARASAIPWRFTLTLEQCAYLVIFALALLTRLWQLDNRALHHDETLHAEFSYALFNSRGYVHDPLLHGPFLYYAGALVFFLFGDNDYTARLAAAIFGIAMVMLPYLLRRELGRGAALLASAYLLISPIFLYVGRFIRHDPFAVVFELLALIGMVRYGSTRRPRWLYLTAIALSLMFTTMETFFLYMAIFTPVLLGAFFWRVWKPGAAVVIGLAMAIALLVFVLPGHPERPFPGSDSVIRVDGQPYTCPWSRNPWPAESPMVIDPDRAGPIFDMPPLATADNSYALCVRHQPDNDLGIYLIKLWQFFRHPSMIIGILLTIATAGGLYWRIWYRRDATGQTAWQRARAAGDGTMAAFASLGDWRRLAIAGGMLFGCYATFFTAFFTNPVGVISGTTGSLLYWLAQHEVKRGGQPAHYYLVQLFIYEPLVVVWWIAGLVLVLLLALRRRRQVPPDHTDSTGINWQVALPPLLAYWSIATMGLYSWAGEKMPWLTIHVALPMVLLAAWAVARVVGWWHAGGALLRPLAAFAGGASAILGLCYLLIVTSIRPDAPRPEFLPFVMPLALILLTLLAISAGLLLGRSWAIGALAITLSLAGMLYTARSSYHLSFVNGDVPREMMIYTQTSPDVKRVVDRLADASTRRGGTLGMPIWYDNETVWDWYMRRFTAAVEQPPQLGQAPGSDVMAVLMLQENFDTYPQNLQFLGDFRLQRYPLRWWFPEDQTYRLPSNWLSAPVDDRSPLLMRMLRTPFDTRTSVQFWNYMLFRIPPAALGSSDFIVAVRPELAFEIGPGTGGRR